MRRIAILIIALGAALGVWVSVLADEGSQVFLPKDAVLMDGEYRDLTWYRKLKLGTAPYFNPGLLRVTAIAYKYDAGKFTDLPDWSAMAAKLKAGEVGLAKHGAKDVYMVLKRSAPEWAMVVASPDGLQQLKGNVVFISTSDILLGMLPTDALVSWYAVTPLETE